MALKRSYLTAMGLTEEQVNSIIEAHSDTVNALKEQIAELKDNAEELKTTKSELEKVQNELDEAKKNSDPDEAKQKYDALKKEYDDFKKDIEQKETESKLKNAYKGLLKEAGVSERRIDTIIKASGDAIKNLKFDKEGKIVDADKVSEAIKKEWADFIEVKGSKGANPATPPTSIGGDGMTKEKIMSIKDGTERRAMIASHPELFGISTNGGNE